MHASVSFVCDRCSEEQVLEAENIAVLDYTPPTVDAPGSITARGEIDGYQFGLSGMIENTVELVIPELGIVYTKVEARPATQTENGNTEYYTCTDGKYYVRQGNTYVEIAENSWVVPALGNWSVTFGTDFSYENDRGTISCDYPEYDGSGVYVHGSDGITVNAKNGYKLDRIIFHVCSNDGNIQFAQVNSGELYASYEYRTITVSNINAKSLRLTNSEGDYFPGEHFKISSIEIYFEEAAEPTYEKVDYCAPTDTAPGNEEYYIGSDGRFYVKDGESYVEVPEGWWIIPMLEVTYTKVDAVPPTATTEGNSEYYTGSDGKFYVKDGESYVEVAEGSWIIPRLHDGIYRTGTVNVSELKVGEILLEGVTIYCDKLNDGNGWNWFIYSAVRSWNGDDPGHSGITGLSTDGSAPRSFVVDNNFKILSINNHEILVEENTPLIAYPDGTVILLTKTAATAPTATTEGNSEYYTGSDGKFYVMDGESYVQVAEGSWIIPSLEVRLTGSVTAGDTTTEYTSFTEAVAAWNAAGDGASLTLLSNVTTDSTIGITGTKTLDLNGHSLTGTTGGTVIDVTGAELTLEDGGTGGYITGYTGTSGYACVYIGGGGTVIMNSGSIKDNTHTGDNAAAVYLYYNASFIMNGGSITGNTAAYGPAVCSAGSFTLNGGTISGNTATEKGAVLLHGPMTMTGGSVTNNTSGQGALAVWAAGSLNLSGNPRITGNTKLSGGTSNVYLLEEYNKKITITGELGKDALIGVDVGTSDVFTDSPTTACNDASKFTSDNEGYAVFKNADGQLFLDIRLTGSVTDGETTTNYTTLADALAAWNAAGDGASLTLLSNVTTDSTIGIMGTKTLDLNGHSLTGTTGGTVIDVTGAELTLEDSGTGGYITGFTGTSGGSCITVSAGTVIMNGGCIKDNANVNGNGNAAAVFLNYNASFMMNGGSITGNTAAYGPAVYSNANCSFTMNGGTISGNTATAFGAVLLHSPMTMTGGSVTNNTAGQGALAVWAAGSLNLSGNPRITGNTKLSGGTSDVYLLEGYNKKITVTGELGKDALIGVDIGTSYVFTDSPTPACNDASKFTSDNESYAVGRNADGQLFLDIRLTGSVTDGETTTKYTTLADALAAWNAAGDGASLTLLSNVTTDSTIGITGTKTLDLNGHSLTGTTGGTVIDVTGAELTLEDSGTDGYITGFTGTSGGSCITVSAGTVIMNGGCIMDNANVYGNGNAAAVFLNYNASFMMNGGSITGNTAAYGPAVYSNASCSFTMNGGTISGNTATAFGAVLLHSPMTMTGGSVTNNTAGQGALAVWAAGSLNLSGNPRITGNTKLSGGASNVYLLDGYNKKITVTGELGKDALIGVDIGTSYVFTDSPTPAYNDASKFTSDNESYVVGRNADGQLFTGTPISSVTVTDITAPVAGEALDTEASTTTSHVTLGAITWDPSSTPAAYATEYTVTVTAAADADCCFTDTVTAAVGGRAATVTRNPDGTLSISCTFAKTDLNPVTIGTEDNAVIYSADGIDIPVSSMFNVPTEAGEATWSITNGTGMGTYNAQTGKLTVTVCGTFTVTVSTAATDTHSAANASATLTVNKADPANTVGLLSAFLGQTLADVALPTADNGMWSWEDSTTTELNTLGTATYTARFTPNDTDNYNTLENVSVQIQVAEKPVAVPADVTKNERIYDGTEEMLVTVDDSTLVGGTMQYALGTDATSAPTTGYTASIPTATDAGTYYVWCKAVGDANHNDTAAFCVTVSIFAPPFGEPTFKLPMAIKRIEESAFEGIEFLAVVEIPDGCESIGKWAFKDCERLTQIRIPASVEEIDETAFDGCEKVFIYGASGSEAQSFCDTHDNCTFVAEDTDE